MYVRQPECLQTVDENGNDTTFEGQTGDITTQHVLSLSSCELCIHSEDLKPYFHTKNSMEYLLQLFFKKLLKPGNKHDPLLGGEQINNLWHTQPWTIIEHKEEMRH